MTFNCLECGGQMKPLLNHYYCPKDCDRVGASKTPYYGQIYDYIPHPVTRRQWNAYLVDEPTRYGALLWPKSDAAAWGDCVLQAIRLSYIDTQSTRYEGDWCIGSTLYCEGVSDVLLRDLKSMDVKLFRFVPTRKEDIDRYPGAIE